MPSFIDGGWFDLASFGVALLYALYRKIRFNKHVWICKETGIDVADGVGLFPLLMLAMASFSTPALHSLLTSNKIIPSVAGVVAPMAILEEDAPRESLRITSP
ncbi:MAG TPA: hypothetical protein VG889_04695 [Rhizomicrobium sp.]|nr:hypothetical protein [Rhizomicrobium sp.]